MPCAYWLLLIVPCEIRDPAWCRIKCLRSLQGALAARRPIGSYTCCQLISGSCLPYEPAESNREYTCQIANYWVLFCLCLLNFLVPLFNLLLAWDEGDLDVVRCILAQYLLVARHDSPVCASRMGLWFAENIQFDIGKYSPCHTMDTVHLTPQTSCPRLKSMILLSK